MTEADTHHLPVHYSKQNESNKNIARYFLSKFYIFFRLCHEGLGLQFQTTFFILRKCTKMDGCLLNITTKQNKNLGETVGHLLLELSPKDFLPSFLLEYLHRLND